MYHYEPLSASKSATIDHVFGVLQIIQKEGKCNGTMHYRFMNLRLQKCPMYDKQVHLEEGIGDMRTQIQVFIMISSDILSIYSDNLRKYVCYIKL
jgi:hypothetical protein